MTPAHIHKDCFHPTQGVTCCGLDNVGGLQVEYVDEFYVDNPLDRLCQDCIDADYFDTCAAVPLPLTPVWETGTDWWLVDWG